MVVHIVSASGSRRTLAIINLAEIVSTLCIFVVALVVDAVRKQELPKPWPVLRKCQISLSGFIVCLSIAHCAILGQHLPDTEGSDPLLVSSLFNALMWLVLSIFLFEEAQEAGIPQYSAWMSTMIFGVVELSISTTNRYSASKQLAVSDSCVLLVKILSIFALLTSGFVVSHRRKHSETPLTEDETQPLLDPEANNHNEVNATSANGNDQKAKNRDKGGDDGDDDNEDEDEESKEEDEEDAEVREELKKRSLRQYIASFGIFLPLIRPASLRAWVYLAIMQLCTALQRATNILIPASLGNLINKLPDAAANHTIPWKALIIYLSLNTLESAGIITMVNSLVAVRYRSKIKQTLSVHCYGHIMDLSCDFHDGKSSQRINRVIQHGSVVVNLFEQVFFEIFPRITDLVLALGVVTYLFGGYLCFTVALTIVLFTYANTKFVKQKTKYRRKWFTTLLNRWNHLWETVYSWQTVSHFNRLPHEKVEQQDRTEKMWKQDIISNDFDALARFVRQNILGLGFIVVSYMAVRQITLGYRGIGDFVMLNSYWGQVMAPITGLISILNTAAEQLIDTERLMLLLEKKPTVRDPDNAKDLDFQGGAVEFENVSFSYDGERVVSEDISFKVKAGQTVAIVGETGGGKSTLLKLLFRFYDPTKGTIRIDGQDIRDVRAESFRELIGYVPQDPGMFRRSVKDNVRYPDFRATDEEVEEACKGAVLHDKIMSFTKGYKQKVGERGTRLSGGEAQRLAVARVILKKPKMLLLDEATSSVDSVTENKIHEGLKKLCEGRTTFIIAHRLSTILHADLILVMKNGKLVEQGPHRKLIKREGAYRELWTAQLKLQQAQNPEEGDEKTEGGTGGDSTSTTAGSPTLSKKVVVDEQEGKELLLASGILDGISESESTGRSRDASTTRNSSPARSSHVQDQ